MAVKEIVTIKSPDSFLLTEPCIEVPALHDWVKALIQDMKDTSASLGGLGIAANQIGSQARVLLVEEKTGPVVIINPKYIARTGKVYSFGEKCFSAGGPKDIKRFKQVIIEGLNENFEPIRIKCDKKPYVFAYQHEMDHLNGITILDK